MSIRYKDGSYVGGCGAQIAGTISVIILIYLNGTFPKFFVGFWNIVYWIIRIIVVVAVILFIVSLFIKDKDKDEKQDKDNLD